MDDASVEIDVIEYRTSKVSVIFRYDKKNLNAIYIYLYDMRFFNRLISLIKDRIKKVLVDHCFVRLNFII